jgi:hypothetical protein
VYCPRIASTVWISENQFEQGLDCREDGEETSQAKSLRNCYAEKVFTFWMPSYIIFPHDLPWMLKSTLRKILLASVTGCWHLRWQHQIFSHMCEKAPGRFEVLTHVIMKVAFFCDVTSCSLVDCFLTLGGTSVITYQAACWHITEDSIFRFLQVFQPIFGYQLMTALILYIIRSPNLIWIVSWRNVLKTLFQIPQFAERDQKSRQYISSLMLIC